MDDWYRIDAYGSRSFVAGLKVRKGVIVDGAPILHWTKGKPISEIEAHCKRQGWTIERLRPAEREQP